MMHSAGSIHHLIWMELAEALGDQIKSQRRGWCCRLSPSLLKGLSMFLVPPDPSISSALSRAKCGKVPGRHRCHMPIALWVEVCWFTTSQLLQKLFLLSHVFKNMIWNFWAFHCYPQRLRQEEYKFEISIGYEKRPWLKKQKTKKFM